MQVNERAYEHIQVNNCYSSARDAVDMLLLGVSTCSLHEYCPLLGNGLIAVVPRGLRKVFGSKITILVIIRKL
jgi:hypothetical protein